MSGIRTKVGTDGNVNILLSVLPHGSMTNTFVHLLGY
jgi:hypothetical protein